MISIVAASILLSCFQVCYDLFSPDLVKSLYAWKEHLLMWVRCLYMMTTVILLWLGSGMEDNKQDQVDGNLSGDKSSMPSSKQEVFCFLASWLIHMNDLLETWLKNLYIGRISLIHIFPYTHLYVGGSRKEEIRRNFA